MCALTEAKAGIILLATRGIEIQVGNEERYWGISFAVRRTPRAFLCERSMLSRSRQISAIVGWIGLADGVVRWSLGANGLASSATPTIAIKTICLWLLSRRLQKQRFKRAIINGPVTTRIRIGSLPFGGRTIHLGSNRILLPWALSLPIATLCTTTRLLAPSVDPRRNVELRGAHEADLQRGPRLLTNVRLPGAVGRQFVLRL